MSTSAVLEANGTKRWRGRGCEQRESVQSVKKIAPLQFGALVDKV